MRTVTTLVLVLVAGWVVGPGLRAGDKKEKEVTLKGTILCAKCALKETKTCQTIIQVKEAEKTVTYYFDDKGHKEEYHEAVCGGERKDGTVVGTVSMKDGKNWIRPSRVEYTKK